VLEVVSTRRKEQIVRPEIQARIETRVRSRRRVRELNRRIGDGTGEGASLLIFLYKTAPTAFCQCNQVVEEGISNTEPFDKSNVEQAAIQ